MKYQKKPHVELDQIMERPVVVANDFQKNF
jgi:hypothetical protein